MDIPRRNFLKDSLAMGSAIILGTTLLPRVVTAADWPKVAFAAKNVEDALMALFGSSDVQNTDKISIQGPEIAENGAVVPIEITADLPKVQSIAIIAEKNPVPLVAQFSFADPEKSQGWIKTRIKMSETSQVIAVVKAEDKLYTVRREIKVTIGGCGG